MSTDNIDEVIDRIGDNLLAELDAITRFGFGRYQEIPLELRIDLGPRAQANCIYDYMMAEAARKFIGRTELRPIDMRGLQAWAIQDHTLIRFKKMDATGAKRNYPTKQTREYDRGDNFPELPAAAIRLTVGYFSDPTSQTIERVQVAYPRGKKIDWCAAILPQSERVAGQRIWTDVTMQPRLTG